MNASEILRKAADTIDARAQERGEVAERSMARTIAMFNAHWGTNLTEQQGWSFMQHLKAARNISGHKEDDLIDKVAYAALEAENVLAGSVDTPVTTANDIDNIIPGIIANHSLREVKPRRWLYCKKTHNVCIVTEVIEPQTLEDNFKLLGVQYDMQGACIHHSKFNYANALEFMDYFYLLDATDIEEAISIGKVINLRDGVK